MAGSEVHLLGKRRFAPLFATQLLATFNDNLFRSALLFLLAYQLLPGDPAASASYGVAAGGVFVLPYFLFSSVAGELADKMDKARLIRIIKIADLVVMIASALALLAGSIPMLMAALFAGGTRAVFFGPLKFSILPQHLADGELLGGTGLIQGSGFIAILLGQIAGGLLAAASAAWLLVVISVAGLASSWAIPPARASHPEVTIRGNILAATLDLVREPLARPRLLSAILGISWFYALGAVFTSQLPALVRNIVGARESVAALFLAAFSIGIAVGAVGVGRLLKGRVSMRFVPLSAILLSLFTVDLWLALSGLKPPPTLLGIEAFTAGLMGWRILFDLFAIAACAASFAVPLYAVLQTAGDPTRRSRDIAANNLVNALVVTVAAGIAALMLAHGFPIPELFLAFGLTTLAMAVAVWLRTRAA